MQPSSSSELRSDEPFDAYAAMTELTLRIATETLFGSDESESAQAGSPRRCG